MGGFTDSSSLVTGYGSTSMSYGGLCLVTPISLERGVGGLFFNKSVENDSQYMNEDLLDYLVRMIRPLFPMNACVVAGISGGDYIIQIDWKLENNSPQLNKRSRKIKIKISEKAIQDYLDHNNERAEQYDSRLKNLIYQWYSGFNPHHDAGTARLTPTENWLISRDLLNG